uniref:LOB domain-containing protein n=1 Tax=Nelumbo nucifera TaxID=4432 RepID=A0A822XPI3_NELNU|nr:TPA_asm: hypothetical protein HUJ06_022574 [Nelumbo nucifera]
MQKSNSGASVHHACAACKHQRKRCGEDCILAPLFTPEKTQQFQAVHKVFGVSNVQKMLRKLDSHESRVKAAESLIWEAVHRQKDPIHGCYGEYKRVVEELKSLKRQQMAAMRRPESMIYKPGPALVDWSNNNNANAMGVNNSNYIQSSGSLLFDAVPYSIQGQEKGSHGRDPLRSVVCSPNPMNGFNQTYNYLPGDESSSMQPSFQ